MRWDEIRPKTTPTPQAKPETPTNDKIGQDEMGYDKTKPTPRPQARPKKHQPMISQDEMG